MIQTAIALVLGGFIGVFITAIALGARINKLNEIASLLTDIALDILRAENGVQIDELAYHRRLKLVDKLVREL